MTFLASLSQPCGLKFSYSGLPNLNPAFGLSCNQQVNLEDAGPVRACPLSPSLGKPFRSLPHSRPVVRDRRITSGPISVFMQGILASQDPLVISAFTHYWKYQRDNPFIIPIRNSSTPMRLSQECLLATRFLLESKYIQVGVSGESLISISPYYT